MALGDTPLADAAVTKTEGELSGVMKMLHQQGPGTVHLYTVVTAKVYHVIVTTPYVQVPRTYPITAAALRCKVFALRAALQNPAIDPRPLAQELYQILLGPVA